MILLLMAVAAATAASCDLADAPTVSASYALCAASRACSAAFYVVPSTDAYSRRVFEHLYRQYIAATPPSDATADAICNISAAADAALVDLWTLFLAQARFCNANEQFVIDVGCQCRHGHACDEAASADGVAARTTDRRSFYVLAGAILVTVVLLAYQLVQFSRRVLTRLDELETRLETKKSK